MRGMARLHAASKTPKSATEPIVDSKIGNLSHHITSDARKNF